MGKSLIIKGANFYANSIGRIEELYEDITDSLIQGFASPSGSAVKLYNSSYNSSNSLIPNFLILMNSPTSLYNTQNKGVEWLIPEGLKIRPWFYKPTSTIGSDGTISNATIGASAAPGYIEGHGQWVSEADLYSAIGASQSTYPCYMGNVCKLLNTESLSLAEAKALGFKVRKLRGV